MPVPAVARDRPRFPRTTPTAVAALTAMATALALAGSGPLATPAHANPDPDANLDGAALFEQLRPVLEARCLACHNPNNPQGDVSLATAAQVLDPDSGWVVPGDPAASLLHQVSVAGPGEQHPYMPKEGDPLTADEAGWLAAWITAGAPWPEGVVLRETSKADRSWWAFQPLDPGDAPATDDAPEAWRTHPVDAHVWSALNEAGLEPNPQADRPTLVRRAHYVLHGLPPTPDEVAAFVDDPAGDDEAWSALIDRLLDSPRYGERWGRHWLDVVRFGESRGFERNQIITNLWPFRDYVIRSLNEDKPFDQLIREHLAGDVIGRGDPAVEIGSAFLVAGPYDDVGNQDAVAARQIRADTLDEIIRTTGEAFLGLSIGCARCHDHKFDPVLIDDYYALYATFSAVEHGERVLATEAEIKADREARAPLEQRRGEIDGGIAAIEEAINQRIADQQEELAAGWTREPVDRRGVEESFEPMQAAHVRLVSEAIDTNPAAASGFRIDEFEVWTGGDEPRNVALASEGASASGESRQVEDYPDAYGPQLAIDGQFGARFHATGTTLTIHLAEPVEIARVKLSSARDEAEPGQGHLVFVADYRIEISSDGESWREVAHGRDRQPVNDAHRQHRLRRAVITDDEEQKLAALRHERGEVERGLAGLPSLPVVWVGNRNAGHAAGPFHVFLGGSPEQHGDPVAPASLSTLELTTPGYRLADDAPEHERRLALADWLVHPDNPLTPRVLANRVWQHHFGTGIVETPNDFGYMGGRPSHPQLLDLLARELVDNGWRIKDLHRWLMTSRAWRQSSGWREPAARVDAGSRLLWRFPPRRLAAEEIRDTMLAVSGQLPADDPGGPGFRLYQYHQDNVATYIPLDRHGPETWRRSVYHHNARASTIDLLTEFDQPDCAFSAARRDATTTPMQALVMLNHAFTFDMASALAGRLESAGDDDRARMGLALQLAWQRPPADDEIGRALEFVAAHGWQAFARALLNTSEMIFID